MIHNISRFIAALAIILLTAQTAGATETSTITVGSTDYTLFTGFTATGGNGRNYAKLVDGNTTSDWSASKNDDDPNAPANDFAGGTADPAFVEFHADEPFIPKGYVLTCDHENAGFWKPVEWALKAKLNEGDGWTTIHSSTTTLGQGKTFEIACNNDGDNQYQYFRLEVYEVGTTDAVVLDELQFYGSLPAYTHLTVKAATCTATGIKVDCYRRNSDGKYFTDNTGETEIPESDVIAPIIPHTGEHHEATDVNIEYWQCSMCGKLFSDEDCTTEITEEQTKIYRTITIDGSISGLVTLAFSETQALAGTTMYLNISDLIDASTLKVNNGAVELTAVTDVQYSFTMPAADVTVTAEVAQSNADGDVLTGSIRHTVTITNGANITLSDATITGSIVCEGSATITLVGTNSVSGAMYKAGIQIGGSGTTLTIKGDGSLTANGGRQSAGIGLSRAWKPDNDVIGGDIVIEGGNITANGGTQWGAGIGTGVIYGGKTAQIGNVTIKGGTVKATGGSDSDGIGTGYTYSGCTNAIGTVTIYDAIDKVDASSIKDFASVVYMHGETNVTASKTDYFAISEDGNHRLIIQKLVIADIPDQSYTGSEITPEPTVTIGSLSLTKGTDYTYSYENNTNVGTATVTVTFQGDYASLGSVEKEFTIAPWSGSGIASDPFIIENPSQLLLLAHRVNGTNGETANDYYGMYFKLGADITFTHPDNEGNDYAENYEAIGGYIGGSERWFYGNFDGDGHTVSGIRIRKTGSDDANSIQGLFGYIGIGADIRNVHLTDARITGYQRVAGIVGFNIGTVSGCTVTDSYITCNAFEYGTICARNAGGTLTNNYYHGCTVNGTAVTSGMGCNRADIAANNGALPAYRLDLGANITTPPGTFVGQEEWLDTPPVSPRLAPENGFTLAGNHYFASGYVFTPGSTLASGAAQGYTPRATLGDQLLDPYTPTGDTDPLAGKAIARLTITADCDGKTLASTQAIYSTRQPVTVAYIKADGTPGEASAIALDGTETSLAAGTYFAGLENVNFDHTVNLTGDVNLILADGKTMKVRTTKTRDGISAEGHSLHIYGQTEGTGTLNAQTNGKAVGIRITNGTLGIHGGNVNANEEGTVNTKSAIRVERATAGDALVIDRGTLTANNKSSCGIYIEGGDVRINGGQVTATGEDFGIDISDYVDEDDESLSIPGILTLSGGTLTASSFNTRSDESWAGTLAIAPGLTYTDGTSLYDSTTETATLAALGGKTLQPCLVLNETDGVTPLTALAGQANVPVIFTRTFSANVASTICLPFDYTKKEGDGSFYAFTSIEYSGGEYIATMTEPGTTTLTANTPYLYLPSATGNVEFRGTPTTAIAAGSTTSGDWTFQGTYDEVKWDTAPTGIYGFSAQDVSDQGISQGEFVKVGAKVRIRPLRAYLKYKNGTEDYSAATTRGTTAELPDRIIVRLIGSDGNTTAIGNLDTRTGEVEIDTWYDLNGRKLAAKPTHRGIYINNGRKVAIK